ncbi:MAG: hypothetical protein GQ574_10785 [Crocinitomix sp.]|nr:hypothetical protein [Crocinitomix sp.]
MFKSPILIVVSFLFFGAISFGQTKSTDTLLTLRLAQEMCALRCDIYGLDRLVTIEKANGTSWSGIRQLKGLRDSYANTYDSLKAPFQLSIHNNPLDFENEAGQNAWFVVIQDFLHQRGIKLSANHRFKYVNLLPQNGYATVEIKWGSRDTFLTSYMIDSASYLILNRHYPNWEKSPANRIQKLDFGIDAFLKMSREHFIPFTAQSEPMNCGPTCLKMVLEQFGTYHSLEELAELSDLDETGTSFGDLARAALQLNMTTENYQASYEVLMLQMDRPVIVHWNNRHFVVVYAMNAETVWVADPDWGRIKYTRKDFCDSWLYGTQKTRGEGSMLTFQLTKAFYE